MNITQQKTETAFDIQPHREKLKRILEEIQEMLTSSADHNYHLLTGEQLRKILVKYPYEKKYLFKRSHLIAAYRLLTAGGEIPKNDRLLHALKMKPIRTQSGVTPVTVLTKPFPCPGRCIFCPNDVRMPKSYIASEPGAQRAERNAFDPYLQTYNRLLAFYHLGHSVDKVELLILGGTWSSYPESYQIWFLKRCFDALNDFPHRDQRKYIRTKNIFANSSNTPSLKNATYNEIIMRIAQGDLKNIFPDEEKARWEELFEAQKMNERAYCRNVGLVLETRPDCITEEEVIKLRRFGCTKVQIGIQSVRDNILRLNKRGHTQKETTKAIALLRLAGFKIHAHWMPQLYGATVESDITDYQKLWQPPYSPDELKIYPTSIIQNTELYKLYKEGKYQPYTDEKLLHLLTTIIPQTPRYVRLSRIVRDIPSTEIVAGNKTPNLRQIAEAEIKKQGKKLQDIRGREIKDQCVSLEDLEEEIISYPTTVSTEYFLSFKTKKTDKIAAFLRLSLPHIQKSKNHFIEELRGCAHIREVHVYGEAVGIGRRESGRAQHLGLGTRLIHMAENISKREKYKKLAVISAIGTREYYKKRGFINGNLYLIKNLT